MKKQLEKWCETTSCHGVIDLFQTQSWFGKTFWSILILGSLGVASWQVYELMIEYVLGDHYYTTTYTANGPLLPFPNITLCNFNRADRKKVLKFGMTSEGNSSEIDPDYLNYFYKEIGSNIIS